MTAFALSKSLCMNQYYGCRQISSISPDNRFNNAINPSQPADNNIGGVTMSFPINLHFIASVSPRHSYSSELICHVYRHFLWVTFYIRNCFLVFLVILNIGILLFKIAFGFCLFCIKTSLLKVLSMAW